jgi:Leucine-rich repeat (LRR) protein
LQSLDLSGTTVTDIEPLKGLTVLELLDLSRTNVTDLGPVYDLPHLRIKAKDSPPVQHFRDYRRERKLPY